MLHAVVVLPSSGCALVTSKVFVPSVVNRDISDVRAGVGAAGLDVEERLAEAQHRLKDETADFSAPQPPDEDPPG